MPSTWTKLEAQLSEQVPTTHGFTCARDWMPTQDATTKKVGLLLPQVGSALKSLVKSPLSHPMKSTIWYTQHLLTIHLP